MGSTSSLWEQNPFVLLQCFLLPFSFLFYFLAKGGHLSLTCRYLFVAVGGCILAVVSMGNYCTILFTSAFVFVVLVHSVDPRHVFAWVFAFQMSLQTFWHLLIQYREYYLQEPISIRLFLSASTLMLLTQRITSASVELQEKKVVPAANVPPHKRLCVMFLPLISYILSFTTLLGGPLCSFGQFVSSMEGIAFNPPPNPLTAVFLKLTQVFLLERVRDCLVYFLKWNLFDPSNSSTLHGILWVWVLAVVFRIQYYSHWKMSECLNNAAGFGFLEDLSGGSANWSGLSDGDIWSTEKSSRVSEFARKWNKTTASWLRWLIYTRCKRFGLLMTFGFSLWWHGLHLGHFVGFLMWAAMVKADYYIHRQLHPNLSSKWKQLLYKSLSWINTQMVITCIVIAIELRDMSGLKILTGTYVTLFPLFNIVALLILSN